MSKMSEGETKKCTITPRDNTHTGIPDLIPNKNVAEAGEYDLNKNMIKRAMAYAYVESNGTRLTQDNWDDAAPASEVEKPEGPSDNNGDDETPEGPSDNDGDDKTGDEGGEDAS